MGATKAAAVFGFGLGVLLSAAGLWVDDWRFWVLGIGVNVLRALCHPRAAA